jgi:hypothetical protein
MTHSTSQRWDDERDIQDEIAAANSGPSSTHEIIREQVRYDGQFCRDVAWILSDFDTWERNPFYKGPEVPQPEL